MNKYPVIPDLFPPKWVNNEEKITIEVRSIVNFSESEEKVSKAIKNLFPDLQIEKNDSNYFIGTSNNILSLFHFFKLIFDQQILDVARKCAIEGVYEKNPKKTHFYLNKQIAYIKKVNFSTLSDSPLGPIEVSIETENMDQLIDRYFPKFEWFSSKTME